MLAREDLWGLEDYAEKRAEFREQVMAHKQNRRVQIGAHVVLVFEDLLTIRYQIQEMLRIEKVFESAGIQEELDAYNPLIPDGDNWKCSMLIQYPDVDERKQRLKELIGIEQKVWASIGEGERLFGIADEDMERANETKTSAVHFLRFQLGQEDMAAAQRGERITFGIEHGNYAAPEVTLDDAAREALAADLGPFPSS